MKEESIILDPEGEKLDSAKAYLDQKPTMPKWVSSPLPKEQNPREAQDLYQELKSASGLEHYAEVNRLIEEGDADGLKQYMEKIKGNTTLLEAIKRLLPYIG